jgi:hypothetical protein
MADDASITSPTAGASPRTPFWDHAPVRPDETGDQDVYVEFNPLRLTDWERVTLGGIELPGVCRVRTPGRQRRVDVANAPGEDVSALIDVGAMAAEVVISCTMWTPSHLARWENFCEVAREWFGAASAAVAATAAGEKTPPPAMDVYHPGLALVGVTSLYLRQVSPPEPGAVTGTMTATITAVEWRHRPKPKKNQAVKTVDISLDGLDKKSIAKELQPKASTPSQTEVKP